MMNRRQQKYFLLGMILVSFLLLGQIGGEECREDCFGIEDDEKRSISSLAEEYYDIDVKINERSGEMPADENSAALCSGGTVTPMEARVVERTGRATFTVTPGGCKSMSVYVRGGIYLNPLSPSSVVGTTITFRASGVDLDSIVNRDLIVLFFDDCTGKYPLSDDCEVDEETSESEEDNGGTPLITDGEPVNPLPEPEPEQPPVVSCQLSGLSCPTPNTLTSFCCSGYCDHTSRCH